MIISLFISIIIVIAVVVPVVVVIGIVVGIIILILYHFIITIIIIIADVVITSALARSLKPVVTDLCARFRYRHYHSLHDVSHHVFLQPFGISDSAHGHRRAYTSQNTLK